MNLCVTVHDALTIAGGLWTRPVLSLGAACRVPMGSTAGILRNSMVTRYLTCLIPRCKQLATPYCRHHSAAAIGGLAGCRECIQAHALLRTARCILPHQRSSMACLCGLPLHVDWLHQVCKWVVTKGAALVNGVWGRKRRLSSTPDGSAF